MMDQTIALVHLGMDDSYGMFFVAGELKRLGLQFQWFDGDAEDVASKIAEWDPDFVFFGPMSVHFPRGLSVSKRVKEISGKCRSVFGGYHVSAIPESIDLDGVDIVVQGPIYQTIEKILSSTQKEIIQGKPASVEDMIAARSEFYETIPRMSERYQKTIMSHMGCPFSCSYCSTSRIRKRTGTKTYNEFWLARRPVENVIEEAKIFLKYPTIEVSLADDDILFGKDVEVWLEEFTYHWKKEIDLPLIAYVSPYTVCQASDRALSLVSDLLNVVLIGVQVAREDSLKLFNREWQNERMVAEAFERLKPLNLPVRSDIMIGLPVEDPIGDALDTIELIKKSSPNCSVSCSPLMLYPGTDLYDWCHEQNIPMDKDIDLEWHKGLGSIRFDENTTRKLKNIKKLCPMFIKYDVDDHWMKAMIELDMPDEASRKLSECHYFDSIKYRHKTMNWEVFESTILQSMDFQY